jgi:hypothetical protein
VKCFAASQKFIEKGDVARTASELERAIKVSPGYADAYGTLAEVHIKMGRYVQALTETSQAITAAGPNYQGCTRPLSLNHSPGKLPEPELTHDFF